VDIEPDTILQSMFLIDDLGNRYDHLQTGDSASQKFSLVDGKSATGWFLFPTPESKAEYFIFHDSDNGIQTPPIRKIWP
jgi:hypothetical protein